MDHIIWTISYGPYHMNLISSSKDGFGHRTGDISKKRTEADTGRRRTKSVPRALIWTIPNLKTYIEVEYHQLKNYFFWVLQKPILHLPQDPDVWFSLDIVSQLNINYSRGTYSHGRPVLQVKELWVMDEKMDWLVIKGIRRWKGW